jgi:methyltransferase (TIGR00027 family)
MDDQLPSRTALVTALMRARHTRCDPRPLIDDTWGDRLVPDIVRAAIRSRALAAMDAAERARAALAPESVVDDALRRLPAYAHVILRSRYAEDALADAVARGTRQYVLIGAGFDSFALRRPAFAREVDIYEVDHPATQQLKLRRLSDCDVATAPSLHFVAADLGREELGAALARSPFRSDRPAFFSWLGVTTYLTRQANQASLRSIAQCAAADSELVFTYLDQRALDAPQASEAFETLKAMVASVSEPFVSGFDPAALPRELRACGLELLEDLDGAQLAGRYDGDSVNGLRCAGASHIARAELVAERGGRTA